MKNKPLLIAHRGFSAKYPENTMIAFERAIANHCDMIELDIHLSKDGELVVHHDFNLGRTANGSGLIFDHSAHDLQKLDAGSWFNNKFKGERIPLLQDVFALVKKQCLLNVEIKHETLLNESACNQMADRLLNLIEHGDMMDSVVVSSFYWHILEILRKKNSDVQLGLLNHDIEKGLRLEDADKIRPYSYHPNYKKLNKGIVDLLHKYDLKVYPYTVNEVAGFEFLYEIGADGIITNEVERLYHFQNK